MYLKEHFEVLRTMQLAGMLTTQQVKTVRGQVLRMPPWEAEDFLRRFIRNTGKKGRKVDEVQRRSASNLPKG